MRLTILFGKILGWFIWRFYPHKKEIALLNLDIAFKNLSNSDKEIIVKKCYIHFSIVLIDFIRARYLNKHKLNKILDFDSESLKLLKDFSNPNFFPSNLLFVFAQVLQCCLLASLAALESG